MTAPVTPHDDALPLARLPALFGRATHVGATAYKLRLKPLQNAVIRAVGCRKPIELAGFCHMGWTLYKDETALAHLHAQGVDKLTRQPHEIGKKGSQVGLVLLLPAENDARSRAVGHVVTELARFALPAASATRARMAHEIVALDADLQRERISYVVPGAAVLEKFLAALGDVTDFQQMGPAERLGVVARRKLVGHLLCALPQPMFNLAATMADEFHIGTAEQGTNSNAVFNTIGTRILELPIAGLISPQDAPMVDCSVDPVIAIWKRRRAWHRDDTLAERPRGKLRPPSVPADFGALQPA